MSTAQRGDASLALTGLLRRIGRHHGERAVRGLVPGLDERPGWIPAADLHLEPVLDGVLAAARRRWPAPAHVSASQGWKCYSFWAAAPVVYSYAVSRRVPLLGRDTLWLRPADHQPFVEVGWLGHEVAVLPHDLLAGSPGAVAVDTDDDLIDLLRGRLFDGHLHPLLAALGRRVRLSRRVLLGSVAAAVAYALTHVNGLVPRDRLLRRGQRLLSRLELDGLVHVGPGTTPTDVRVRRQTCCLKFSLTELRACEGCPIRRLHGVAIDESAILAEAA